jgi:VanZ family protein
MRPLTALLGILMGSAVALATGLVMTWIVILFLPQQEARFAPEQPALLRAIAVFTVFSAASAASFYGELRERRWRAAAHVGTALILGVAVWIYWPK